MLTLFKKLFLILVYFFIFYLLNIIIFFGVFFLVNFFYRVIPFTGQVWIGVFIAAGSASYLVALIKNKWNPNLTDKELLLSLCILTALNNGIPALLAGDFIRIVSVFLSISALLFVKAELAGKVAPYDTSEDDFNKEREDDF